MTAVSSAWQAALAAEYAAIFGYGVLGPRLQDSNEIELARGCEQAHRSLAEQATGQLIVDGQAPGAPLPSYVLPFAVPDAVAARQLAVRLEQAAASAWRYLIVTAAQQPVVATVSGSPAPSSDGAGLTVLRAQAVRTLSDAAVRGVRWRRIVSPLGPTVPFPGT